VNPLIFQIIKIIQTQHPKTFFICQDRKYQFVKELVSLTMGLIVEATNEYEG